jgi:uncharacterized protein (DUF849 family)
VQAAIIESALNGQTGKAVNPSVPRSSSEIAEAARALDLPRRGRD